ncbi:MAG: signal recognition particle-docking protein FtsY [Termitinemataceae bacterium]|nr:MAG: signal recognition particle-docking protein FtsY [Termitinemataceae bacterium]
MAVETIDTLTAKCSKEKINDPQIVKQELFALLLDMLKNANAATEGLPLDDYPLRVCGLSEDKLNVILLLGVNGVGKTTSAAKLAYLFGTNGKVILAAADTFRAAAIDQLKIHGERTNTRVVAHKDGGDPAAVIFDALNAAISAKYRFVIADSAGRMHTKSALVDELKKIDRVVLSKVEPNCVNYKKILVLDATTGTNALSQAEIFSDAVNVDGVILTKFDSDAKGGVVFPLAKKFKLPVFYVCSGEKYEDIAPFNADDYIREFLSD